MYLVITKLNEKIICNTADEVKNFNKKEDIMKIFSLSMVDYNKIVSTSDMKVFRINWELVNPVYQKLLLQ